MILLTMQLQREQTRAERMARRLLKFSILYLFLLFAVLLIEKMLTGTARRILHERASLRPPVSKTVAASQTPRLSPPKRRYEH